MPTLIAFATDAPTTEPTPFATEEPPVEPTTVPTEVTAPNTIAPEQTSEAVAVISTDSSLDFSGMPQVTDESLTVEVVPPTSTPTIDPESTQEALPEGEETAFPVSSPVQETPMGIPLDPESTQEALPQSQDNTQTAMEQPTGSDGSTDTTAMPITLAAIEPVTDLRGQVLDGQVRRDIIAPYGLQGWTFSGYRGEKIQLELLNITGAGNPSLELRNEAGQVVASDIDVTSGDNTDSFLEVTLPSDGVYTVVVRMAAVEEQLYALTLVRVP
jgi:hypothetical protein